MQLIFEKTEHALATIHVVVNAGSVIETEKEYGAAHYLEHMFFKGTETKNYRRITRWLAKLGSWNAYASRGRTVFHIKTACEDLPETAQALAELIFESKLDPDEFNKERGVIQQEIVARDDQPNCTYFDESITHIYGKDAHSTIGTVESINAMTVDTLSSYRWKHYTGPNMVLVVIGDATSGQIKGVKEAFGKYEDKERGGLTMAARNKLSTYPRETEEYHFDHTSKQAWLGFWYPAPRLGIESEMNHVNCVFEEGFGGGMHSILTERIREELGLAYSAGFFEYSFPGNYSGVSYALLDKDKIPQVRDEMQACLEKVGKEGFDAELLDISKRMIRFDMLKGWETADRVASWFDRHFEFENEGEPLEKYRDMIKPEQLTARVMKVTNDDIVRYVNEWLLSKPPIVCIMNA